MILKTCYTIPKVLKSYYWFYRNEYMKIELLCTVSHVDFHNDYELRSTQMFYF